MRASETNLKHNMYTKNASIIRNSRLPSGLIKSTFDPHQSVHRDRHRTRGRRAISFFNFIKQTRVRHTSPSHKLVASLRRSLNETNKKKNNKQIHRQRIDENRKMCFPKHKQVLLILGITHWLKALLKCVCVCVQKGRKTLVCSYCLAGTAAAKLAS